MKVKLDDDSFSEAVAADLLWHAEHAESKTTQNVCLQAAFYYMTFDQVAKYLGSREVAEEYFI